MLRTTSQVAIPGVAVALTVIVCGSLSAAAPAKPAFPAPAVRPAITVTNTNPQFKLTLPTRYKQIASSGGALCTFTSLGPNAGGVFGIYPLAGTIEQHSPGEVLPKLADARRIEVSWKGFRLHAVAWSSTATNGSRWDVRSVNVPLKDRAVRVLVLVTPGKTPPADELLAECLAGLDGPSNWIIDVPPTALERGLKATLGALLLAVVLMAPPYGFLALRRRGLRRAAEDPARADRFRKLAANLSVPSYKSPRYWVLVFSVVLVLILAVVIYFAAAALAVSLLTERRFAQSFQDVVIVCEGLALASILLTAGISHRRYRDRGRVILDLGPDRLRKLFLAVGILCLAAGAFSGIAAAFNTSGRTLQTLCLTALQAVLAIQFLMRATGRVQITEKGIWQNLSLLRWEQIETCRWLNESTLLAQLRTGHIPLLIALPPQFKEEIAELLTHRGLAPQSV